MKNLLFFLWIVNFGKKNLLLSNLLPFLSSQSKEKMRQQEDVFAADISLILILEWKKFSIMNPIKPKGEGLCEYHISIIFCTIFAFLFSFRFKEDTIYSFHNLFDEPWKIQPRGRRWENIWYEKRNRDENDDWATSLFLLSNFQGLSNFSSAHVQRIL